MNTRIAIFLAAVATLANAQYYCYTNPDRGSDNVIPRSVGVATVTTTVQRAGGNLGVEWSGVQCFLYFSYVASDAQGRPLTTAWAAPRTEGMARSSAHGGNTWVGTLPLRNESVLEVVSYCLAEGQQLWCGGSDGNIAFRMPPAFQPRRSATDSMAPRVDLFPAVGSDNVVLASDAVANLYSTFVNANVDWTEVECSAVYNYLPADDYGHLQTTQWGPAITMLQNGREGFQREAQIPVIAGYVLQATSMCNQNGQIVWAPAGNVNFRLSPDQQHPAGSLAISSLSTPLGPARLWREQIAFNFNFVAQCTVPNAATRCYVRYGYPASFGGVWPTIYETRMQPGSSSQWYASVTLPYTGFVLEATARCTCGGLQTELSGNYQVVSHMGSTVVFAASAEHDYLLGWHKLLPWMQCKVTLFTTFFFYDLRSAEMYNSFSVGHCRRTQKTFVCCFHEPSQRLAYLHQCDIPEKSYVLVVSAGRSARMPAIERICLTTVTGDSVALAWSQSGSSIYLISRMPPECGTVTRIDLVTHTVNATEFPIEAGSSVSLNAIEGVVTQNFTDLLPAITDLGTSEAMKLQVGYCSPMRGVPLQVSPATARVAGIRGCIVYKQAKECPDACTSIDGRYTFMPELRSDGFVWLVCQDTDSGNQVHRWRISREPVVASSSFRATVSVEGRTSNPIRINIKLDLPEGL
eukprot:m51a1_g12185 hypothetical protein (691) ;mRNA; f:2592-5916